MAEQQERPAGEGSRRQTAFKVRIADITNNKYIKEEGWLPNYVLIAGKKVSRANILGVIVSKQGGEEGNTAFIIDDGSARIPLRFYEPRDLVSIGDVVVVIGRPREFGSERYLVPEIMKRVKDPKWAEVRKKELLLAMHESTKQEEPTAEAGEADVEVDDLTTDPRSMIVEAIKGLDNGPGAEIDEITVKSGVDNTEFWLKKLLEAGDVFEVRPGRYKVLE